MRTAMLGPVIALLLVVGVAALAATGWRAGASSLAAEFSTPTLLDLLPRAAVLALAGGALAAGVLRLSA